MLLYISLSNFTTNASKGNSKLSVESYQHVEVPYVPESDNATSRTLRHLHFFQISQVSQTKCKSILYFNDNCCDYDACCLVIIWNSVYKMLWNCRLDGFKCIHKYGKQNQRERQVLEPENRQNVQTDQQQKKRPWEDKAERQGAINTVKNWVLCLFMWGHSCEIPVKPFFFPPEIIYILFLKKMNKIL